MGQGDGSRFGEVDVTVGVEDHRITGSAHQVCKGRLGGEPPGGDRGVVLKSEDVRTVTLVVTGCVHRRWSLRRAPGLQLPDQPQPGRPVRGRPYRPGAVVKAGNLNGVGLAGALFTTGTHQFRARVEEGDRAADWSPWCTFVVSRVREGFARRRVHGSAPARISRRRGRIAGTVGCGVRWPVRAGAVSDVTSGG